MRKRTLHPPAVAPARGRNILDNANDGDPGSGQAMTIGITTDMTADAINDPALT